MTPRDLRKQVEALVGIERLAQQVAHPGGPIWRQRSHAILLLGKVLAIFDEHDIAEKAERQAHGDALEEHYGVGGL